MIRKCLNLPMAVASFCLLALITLSSCSRQQYYTNAIPADATEVLSVNLQTLAQKYTDASSASLLLCTESLFANIFGYFLLHEEKTLTMVFGGLLIFISVILVESSDRIKPVLAKLKRT